MQGIVVFDLAYFAEYLNRAAERTEAAFTQSCTELIDKSMKDLKETFRIVVFSQTTFE